MKVTLKTKGQPVRVGPKEVILIGACCVCALNFFLKEQEQNGYSSRGLPPRRKFLPIPSSGVAVLAPYRATPGDRGSLAVSTLQVVYQYPGSPCTNHRLHGR